MRGVEGVSRFLARVWRLFMTENQGGDWVLSGKIKQIDADKAQQKITHAPSRKSRRTSSHFRLTQQFHR